MSKTKKEEWEEGMLENNSYYDIDIINEANAPILNKIKEWQYKYDNASGNMGKWYCQLQIDKLKKKLHKYK
jgi:hypothetical protein